MAELRSLGEKGDIPFQLLKRIITSYNGVCSNFKHKNFRLSSQEASLTDTDLKQVAKDRVKREMFLLVLHIALGIYGKDMYESIVKESFSDINNLIATMNHAVLSEHIAKFYLRDGLFRHINVFVGALLSLTRPDSDKIELLGLSIEENTRINACSKFIEAKRKKRLGKDVTAEERALTISRDQRQKDEESDGSYILGETEVDD
jgi:hypothetical protein